MLKSITAPVTIRPAKRSDCRAICRMIEELAKHHGDVPRISEDVLRSTVFNHDPWIHLLVAERFERPVGYAGLQRSMNIQFGTRKLDIQHLFVTPELRGRGVGRKLIEASAEMARTMGCSDISVGTETTNIAAQRAYFACGFKMKKPSNGAKFQMKLEPQPAIEMAS
jgi:GNAT superfamily N-acetyltransferase